MTAVPDKASPLPNPVRKVLIVQTAFLGDVILATPLVEAAHHVFAPCEVHFMVIPAAANALERHPGITRLVIFDKRGSQRGPAALWQLVRELRRENYAVAVVPHRSLRSALLVWLARIPLRIGFVRSAGARLFTHRVPYRETHEVERNLDLLRPFGVLPKALAPRVPWDEADAAVVAEMIGDCGTGRRWYALAPGSVWATKRWPADRFAQLARALIADHHALVFLVGGESDAELCAGIQAQAGAHCRNLAGRLTLRQAAALLDRCTLLVSNDSAPAHLGVATRCRVLTIFGPTVPRLGFAPYGAGHGVIEKNLACRPCSTHGSRRCPLGTHACMLEISVAEVLARVKDAVQSR
ncbi:MAG: lipopolysaccharide heptosyltransferase II [candidate division KSB1 bacterium]|nr:lipopolysaccharide heptosyltransferase II [candidate division KSB1 bacterium]MDZ7275721.1 lipopolysaccharide heptosyltransferase II [candidate division KSB1 bacterium]MDZ7284588.1 lipopolysaccharide heptosyltransferase II [candidate division KSB1 bacterium]MDZ7297993.1 lipopolysaccharide heptosyltransferase II [candidate division KSB1 bacterium]MDZ7305839.1 lipopolysaccharide heptosyltransferase II [candidate division KSB1 bacterium]